MSQFSFAVLVFNLFARKPEEGKEPRDQAMALLEAANTHGIALHQLLSIVNYVAEMHQKNLREKYGSKWATLSDMNTALRNSTVDGYDAWCMARSAIPCMISPPRPIGFFDRPEEGGLLVELALFARRQSAYIDDLSRHIKMRHGEDRKVLIAALWELVDSILNEQ